MKNVQIFILGDSGEIEVFATVVTFSAFNALLYCEKYMKLDPTKVVKVLCL